MKEEAKKLYAADVLLVEDGLKYFAAIPEMPSQRIFLGIIVFPTFSHNKGVIFLLTNDQNSELKI